MKKKKLFLTIFIGIIFTASIFILSSCESNPTGLPHSTGKTLEMLIVTNNKEMWNNSIGKTIKNYFGQELIGLPQVEPMFTMFHLPQEAFIKMYKSNRNIFIVDIKKDLKEARIETKKDLWAKPQRVIKISAPDKESFLQMFEERKEGILELYHEIERERINGTFRISKNPLINQHKG